MTSLLCVEAISLTAMCFGGEQNREGYEAPKRTISHVDSPNVQVLSGSERTHIEGESIGCSDSYVMVNSRFDHFLEVEQSIGCSNEIYKYLAENCESRRGGMSNLRYWGGGRPIQIGIKCCPNWLGMC